MTEITGYRFGCMTIDGQTYTKDLIILPGGRILPDWYRKSGHLLREADLEAAIAQAPRLIIAGTGASGRMDVAQGLETALKEKGIRFLAMETAQAAERYNREAANQTPGLCGCFHLTC